MKDNFDIVAKETLLKLCEAFNISYIEKTPIVCKYSIGVEIEVKFRYYFPEIFEKYFNNSIKFHEYSEDMKTIINNEINEQEKELLPLLEKTIECGIPRGGDKYWEFSFNPVYDASIIVQQIEILQKVGLIPVEYCEHSLHISIGGLKSNKNSYLILTVLELLFLTKERIQQGFSKINIENYSSTWAKKGRAGIYEKNQNDLVDENIGFEYRTLVLNKSISPSLLFNILVTLLNNNEAYDNIIEKVKNKMIMIGLPNINWEKPHLKPDIWNKYIENFDELSLFANKELINYLVERINK